MNIVEHDQFRGQKIEVLPTLCRLERPGLPNQYFTVEEQEEQLVEVPVEGELIDNPPEQIGEESENDVEPVNDGEQNTAIPPPNHGWIWQDFADGMVSDWRGALPNIVPHVNMVGRSVI